MIIVYLICLFLYFLPTIIAANRKNKFTKSIFIINLFFGWTVIGWILAMAMAFAA